jgi:transcription elongation factor GreB
MKTQLITREGYDKLKQELDFLWREDRPEVTKKVTWAASLGDRSENADYQYNKKRLREIDRRVRYLTKCLEQLRIVEYSPQQDGKVFFGAWVDLNRFTDGPRAAEERGRRFGGGAYAGWRCALVCGGDRLR